MPIENSQLKAEEFANPTSNNMSVQEAKKLKLEDNSVARRVIALYNSYGAADYIGEAISITEHSLQAGKLALDLYPSDIEFVLAALLHDVGHVVGLEAGQKMGMEGCGIEDHEGLGAEFTRYLGFSDRVQKFIRHHVSAKRYLCYKDEGYYNRLTSASRTTLKHQGGVMHAAEAAAFENDPDFELFLRIRNIDEEAKQLDVTAPSLESYESWLNQYSKYPELSVPTAALSIPYRGYILSPAQLHFYKQHGFLKVTNLLAYEGISMTDITSWVDTIASWPKTEGKWLQHWELNSNNEKQMCRSENFVNYHEPMKQLCSYSLLSLVSQLFGEPGALFKEKINYKLPGGAGFAAHQDSPAYIGLAQDHISVMIAIDASTIENGCLWLAPGQYEKGQIELNKDGVVTKEEEDRLTFEPAECVPGDILLFGGYTPHRSEANRSPYSRRAIFLTYNPLSQGDLHEEYYAAKHAGMQGFDGKSAISFQRDFQGQIVDM